MIRTLSLTLAIGAAFSFIFAPALLARGLSMRDAVSIALRAGDPSVERYRETAAALDNLAVADSQLPDPVLRAGQFNLPVDTFSFTQEPSTQFRFDLLQKFPAGDTLILNGQKRGAQAIGEDAKSMLRESQIKLATRTTWLELYYLRGAHRKISKSRRAVRELVKVAIAIFGTGKGSAQDVLRAQVELSVLDDRLIKIGLLQERLRANLVRLIGPGAARRRLSVSLPRLASPPALRRLRQKLQSHPSVQIENARIDVKNLEIDLAGAKYRPEWTAEIRYGIRNAGRPDLVTARVGMTLPIFTRNRQDRRYQAAHHNLASAKLVRDARLLDLRKQLERFHADWKRSGERAALYRRVVTHRTKATTQASLNAYRSGHSDFAELIRSQLAELNAELMYLRLRVNRVKALVNLLYLTGK